VFERRVADADAFDDDAAKQQQESNKNKNDGPWEVSDAQLERFALRDCARVRPLL
jgi:hypothetical protein